MRFDKGYGYESLAVNIVVQAVKDYRSALKKLQQDPEELLRKTEEVLERVNRD